jgi:hypothetical protein
VYRGGGGDEVSGCQRLLKAVGWGWRWLRERGGGWGAGRVICFYMVGSLKLAGVTKVFQQ